MLNLLTPKSDLPFAQDDASRFLPWVIALMVGMTALLISLSFILSASLGNRKAEAANTVSIQIPAEQVSSALVKSVKDELEKIPALGALKEVSPDELRAHLAPWMGELKNPENWPLPYVLRVQTDPHAPDAIAAIRARMEALNADIYVDGNAVWAGQYTRIVNVVQYVLLTLAVLLMLTLATLIVFASRTAMRLHLPAVNLLHGIGASDGYIARQFQQNALALVLKGAAAGTGVALVMLVGLGVALHHMNASLLPRIHVGVLQVLFLLLLPLMAGAVGVVAARFTTLNHLRHMP